MSSDRRFSVTLSEDDLRPHMRKPKPMESEIEALRLKMEKREEVKREVKRRIEEEERERAQRKRDEEVKMEIKRMEEPPKQYRRFNDSQYFNWNDDVPDDVAVSRRPQRLQSPTSSEATSSDFCELCTLAMRGVATKSPACAHIDAFLAAHR